MEMYNSEYYNGQSGEYYSSSTRGSGQLSVQVHQHQLVSPPDKQRQSYFGAGEMLKNSNNEQFVVEEFFDFSNEDGNTDNDNNVVLSDSGEAVFDVGANNGHSTESSSVTTVVGDVGNRNFTDGNDFSNDLCLPYDDLAEFLSNIEEESFSSEDLQKLQLISGLNARMDGTSHETRGMSQPNFNSSGTIFRPEVPVPGKARSKRTRAQPCKWTSRLLAVTPTSPHPESTLVQPVFSTTGKKTLKTPAAPSKNGAMDQSSHWSTDGRKCLHCATDKTPQWRTGPMGPKTLCNACGVRYKSGRLVPEYRPAASPTFMLTKHSNSHRKVLELRRQKEMVIPQHHHHRHNQQLQYLPHRGMVYDVPNDDERARHDYRVPNF